MLYNLIVRRCARRLEIVIQRQRSGTHPELIRVKACGFVQRKMDELVGEWAPFRSKNYEIKKVCNQSPGNGRIHSTFCVR